MTSKTEKLKLKLLAQLRIFPNIQAACERVGVGRSTYYDWCKEDAQFKKEAEKALEFGSWFINDLAESKLVQNIRNGDNTAIIFWLKKHKQLYFDEMRHKHQHRHEIVEDRGIDPETAALIRRAMGNFARKTRQNKRDGIDKKSWDPRDDKKKP